MKSTAVILLNGEGYSSRAVCCLDTLMTRLPNTVPIGLTSCHGDNRDLTIEIAKAFPGVCFIPPQQSLLALPAFFQKPFLPEIAQRELKCERTLVMDVDMIAVGALGELIELTREDDFAVCEFPEVDREKVAGSLKPWRCLWDDDTVEQCAAAIRNRRVNPMNTGLFLARANSPTLLAWQRSMRHAFENGLRRNPKVSGAVKITDEPALELVRFRQPHSIRILEGIWNWSGFHQDRGSARIIHYHDSCHVTDSPLSSLWRTVFRDINERNLAGIRTWGPKLNPNDYR